MDDEIRGQTSNPNKRIPLFRLKHQSSYAGSIHVVLCFLYDFIYIKNISETKQSKMYI